VRILGGDVKTALLTITLLLASCSATPSPSSGIGELPESMTVWGEGARDMVWRHSRLGAPPPLSLSRVEVCRDYALVFYTDPSTGQLLWAGGMLSEPPEWADGGFVTSPNAPEIQARREEHPECRLLFDGPR
jgi:hypothetical protein